MTFGDTRKPMKSTAVDRQPATRNPQLFEADVAVPDCSGGFSIAQGVDALLPIDPETAPAPWAEITPACGLLFFPLSALKSYELRVAGCLSTAVLFKGLRVSHGDMSNCHRAKPEGGGFTLVRAWYTATIYVIMRPNDVKILSSLAVLLLFTFGLTASWSHCAEGNPGTEARTAPQKEQPERPARPYHDCALFIAGISNPNGSLAASEGSPAWARFAKSFNESWQGLEAKRLTPMREWAARELSAVGASRYTVFYPISGADFEYCTNRFRNPPEILRPVPMEPAIVRHLSETLAGFSLSASKGPCRALSKDQERPPIAFGVGYHYRPGSANLLLATRKEAPLPGEFK